MDLLHSIFQQAGEATLAKQDLRISQAEALELETTLTISRYSGEYRVAHGARIRRHLKECLQGCQSISRHSL